MENNPFHNANAHPLPDANEIERETLGARSRPEDQPYDTDADPVQISQAETRRLESDRRKLRNFLIGLLVVGLAIGGLLSVGLVWTMNRLNLIEPPSLEQSQ